MVNTMTEICVRRYVLLCKLKEKYFYQLRVGMCIYLAYIVWGTCTEPDRGNWPVCLGRRETHMNCKGLVSVSMVKLIGMQMLLQGLPNGVGVAGLSGCRRNSQYQRCLLVTLVRIFVRRAMGPLQPMLRTLDTVPDRQPQNRKRSHSASNLLSVVGDEDFDAPHLNSTSGSGASSPDCCSTPENSPSSNGLSYPTTPEDGSVTNYLSRSGDESADTDDGRATPVSEGVKLERGLHGTPKSVPCSFLYDATGSGIYDEIVEVTLKNVSGFTYKQDCKGHV
jgi:hypothetical protein